VTEDPLPGKLYKPNPTGAEKAERWMQAHNERQIEGSLPAAPTVLPGLDLEALRLKYSGPGAGDAPMNKRATFKVPIDIAVSITGKQRSPDDIRDRYMKIRNAAVTKLIDVMEKQGFRCYAGRYRYRIEVGPDNYPWPDLMQGGAGDPEYREFYMLVPFIRVGRITPVRIEMPGHLFEDIHLSQGVRSPAPEES
jgi:hypothetical protein